MQPNKNPAGASESETGHRFFLGKKSKKISLARFDMTLLKIRQKRVTLAGCLRIG
jgi:hypothetical protein